jgi:hypothetical protein
MPTHVAQWAGIAVTAIVVLGSDANVFIALPLGVFAGTLAAVFMALGDGKLRATKLIVRR